ncbi:hypothetical protein BMS3Abin14_00786 [bacterium BMS3Abin14]|nr:hypothetical protein BMS3Abin14_00786 [bacterium BMS3Abin14]
MSDIISFTGRQAVDVPKKCQDPWGGTLPQLCVRLDELHLLAEREFLSVGSRLVEFSDRAGKISEMALSAAGVVSGDEVRGSIAGIRAMIEKIHQYLREAEDEAALNLQVLETILVFLDGIRKNLTALKETAGKLRMLGLTTKIQSIRTGSDRAGFMDLGEEISLLSAEIASVTADLMDESGKLFDFVSSVHTKVKALAVAQQQQVSLIISGSTTVLDSLERLSMKSSDNARQIVDGAGKIRENIAGVVVSMQYQDIGCQVLEKVRNVLAGFCSPAAELASGEGECRLDILIARQSVGQSRTLLGIRDKMAESMENVISSLQLVVAHVDEMSKVAAMVQRNSSTFLRDLGTGMSSVTDFLSRVMASNRAMSENMTSFADTVNSMSKFIGDFERISEEVELIAVNASIKAAQTGSEALGMGVIARAIQKTAEESNLYRGSLLHDLDEASALAGRIRQDIETTAKGKEARLDQMIRDLGVFLDALRYRQEKVMSLLEQLDSGGKAFSHDIDATINGISIHNTIGIVIDDVSMKLQRIAGQILEEAGCANPDEPYDEIADVGLGELPGRGDIEFF